jgi:hypothetical protein
LVPNALVSQDEALHAWEAQVDLFAHEIIGHDGRGDWATDNCLMCDIGQGEYDCKSCGDRLLVCASCMVASHSKFYLHCIRVCLLFRLGMLGL